ncbi:MAG: hypothetical protein KIT32_12110 [Rhodocyclaceae bacterium]|nr:hypothetical protein [Rhodocyclaceae bacterium]
MSKMREAAMDENTSRAMCAILRMDRSLSPAFREQVAAEVERLRGEAAELREALGHLRLFAEMAVETMDIDTSETSVAINVMKDGVVVKNASRMTLAEIFEKADAALRATQARALTKSGGE